MDVTVDSATQLELLASECGTGERATSQQASSCLDDFRIVRATTRDMLEICFQLRYQVYCIEKCFEPRTQPVPGLETDRFDERAIHSLLYHVPTGISVGTVRIVLPSAEHSEQPLPMQQLCKDRACLDATVLPPASTAEISRFAISRTARRQIARASATPNLAFGQVEDGREVAAVREFPEVVLLLMRAIVEMSVDHHVTHLCAVMEPILIRLLARFAVHFTPLGLMVDHHGRRQPCCANLATLLERTKDWRRDVWAVLTDGGRLRPVPLGLAA